MKLNEDFVRTLKPLSTVERYSDGCGLFFVVHPYRGRYWEYEFTHSGGKYIACIGEYPSINLSEARCIRDTIKNGIGLKIVTFENLSAIFTFRNKLMPKVHQPPIYAQRFSNDTIVDRHF